MTFKHTHIALAFLASASFGAVAETVVQGSAVVSEADIIVSQNNAVGLAITPEANITVSDIKEKNFVPFAKFTLSGKDVAVRLLGADQVRPVCADIFGATNNTNKIQACLHAPNYTPNTLGTFNKFVAGGITYFKYPSGREYIIRSGGENLHSPISADTYTLAMEAVQYTL